MKITKRIIGRWILAGLTIISALFAFYIVNIAISVDGASKLIAPLIGLSFFTLFYFVFVIVVKNTLIHIGATVFVFAVSFLFTQTSWHGLFVTLAIGFALMGTFSVRRDISASRTISIGRSVSVGIVYFLIAIALVIVSMYYTSIKDLNQEKLVFLMTQSSLLERTIDSVVDHMIPTGDGDVPLLPQSVEGAQGINGMIDQLPGELKEKMLTDPQIEQQISDIYNLPDGFMEQFGEEIIAGATLRDIMPKIVMLQVEETILQKNTFVWENIAKVLSLILFISVFTIAFVWRFVMVPLIALVFYGILALGVISRKKEMCEVEILQ